jgi:hypothetical protein
MMAANHRLATGVAEMKKADVKVGGRYYANVSGKRTEVRIDAEKPNGGWEATNVATGKKIHIKSAQRLQGEVGRSGKTTKSTVRAPETKATGKCPRGGDHEWTEADGERFCSKCSEPAPAKTAGKKTKRGGASKEKKLSALDAAAKVLAEAAEPMNAKQMIEAMEAKGYWKSPGGKTPWATLYSAMMREVNDKGAESRFRKTERGRFTLT